jgi:hypothetical protein
VSVYLLKGVMVVVGKTQAQGAAVQVLRVLMETRGLLLQVLAVQD